MRSVFPVACVCNEGLQRKSTKAWSFNYQSLVKFVCQMLAKKFTGEEAVCARPGASLACNNWPESSLETSGCRSWLIIHRCRCRAKAIYHSLCLFPSYTVREKTAGYGSAVLQQTERVSEIAFFLPGLVWFGRRPGISRATLLACFLRRCR